jgi:3-oxoacyl-[acyl-carrier-protein] synthase II
MTERRVVITGTGAVTPLGLTSHDLWEGLLEGRCGIRKIGAFDPAEFPCTLAGEVPEYKMRDYLPKSYRKAGKLMSRDIELSVIAADDAVKNSGLVTKASEAADVTVRPERTVISFGAGLISCDLAEIAPCVKISETNNQFDIHKWGTNGMQTLTPLWLLKYLPNMLPCHIGIIHDIQGPSNTITCGEAAGHIAIAEAFEMVARGDADVAFGGGGEAKVNPIVMLRQCLLKRSTETANDTPDRSCRPFEKSASGCVFGEAAGMVILEELEFAKSRKATILAEIIGTASSNNLSPDLIHLEKDGKGLQIAIEAAMQEAGIEPDKIDLIIPAGTGIPEDDRTEAAALKNVFGDALANIPVWPIKSMVSHTGAAAGALDVIAATLAVAHGKIGPASYFSAPASGCELNIQNKAISADVRYALCCGYSFGGQTAAIVIKKYEATE